MSVFPGQSNADDGEFDDPVGDDIPDTLIGGPESDWVAGDEEGEPAPLDPDD